MGDQQAAALFDVLVQDFSRRLFLELPGQVLGLRNDHHLAGGQRLGTKIGQYRNRQRGILLQEVQNRLRTKRIVMPDRDLDAFRTGENNRPFPPQLLCFLGRRQYQKGLAAEEQGMVLSVLAPDFQAVTAAAGTGQAAGQLAIGTARADTAVLRQFPAVPEQTEAHGAGV